MTEVKSFKIPAFILIDSASLRTGFLDDVISLALALLCPFKIISIADLVPIKFNACISFTVQ